MHPHRQGSPTDLSDDDDDDTISIANPFAPLARDRDVHGDEDRRWEAGFKMEIPEFTGGLDPCDFLDWINAVEELLDFKGVPDPRRVPLVATRLRGRASSWWQQTKLSRQRHGKSRISTWHKFRKHLEREFLPFNYEHTLYQRLQTLRQGSRTVDAYTEDFYHLIARVDLRDSPSQLVARYISGLRTQLQDTLHLFVPGSVSEAHQRALLLEQQSARRAPRFGNSAPAQTPTSIGQPPRQNTAPPPPEKHSSNSLRCFGCGEMGHRRTECPRSRGQRTLFSDDPEYQPYDGPPVFDLVPNDPMPEEHVTGDVGPLLVLRRNCLSPKTTSESDIQRHHIF